jgi:hypothetical protein
MENKWMHFYVNVGLGVGWDGMELDWMESVVVCSADRGSSRDAISFLISCNHHHPLSYFFLEENSTVHHKQEGKLGERSPPPAPHYLISLPKKIEREKKKE